MGHPKFLDWDDIEQNRNTERSGVWEESDRRLRTSDRDRRNKQIQIVLSVMSRQGWKGILAHHNELAAPSPFLATRAHKRRIHRTRIVHNQGLAFQTPRQLGRQVFLLVPGTDCHW